MDKDFEHYLVDRKKKSPNNWKNDELLLSKYVLYYFLQVKELRNYNLWRTEFDSFINWLDGAPTIKGRRRALSTSSKNHIVKCLNAFLKSMYKRGSVDSLHACEYYDRSTIGKKGIEDLISLEELRLILNVIDHNAISEAKDCAKFKLKLKGLILIMYYGGFRANEAMGLSLFNLKIGEPDSAFFVQNLRRYEIESRMHITLESQLANDTLSKVRDAQGNVISKPLKGKKEKRLELNRIVPLSNQELINIIVELRSDQALLLDKKKYGTDLRNYLLFDGISYSVLSSKLRRVYRILRTRYPNIIKKEKTAHCFRHQFATDIALKVRGDIFFTSLLLGHSERSPKTTLNYIHLAEQIRHQVAVAEQVEDNWEALKA